MTPKENCMTTLVPEKLCIFCPHLDMQQASYGSTMTGAYGEDGFECKKGHFSSCDAGHVDTVEEMRALFLRAETCPDYIIYKDVPK